MGYLISATKGANMTVPRATRLESPRDVTANSVGNIGGWATHTAVKDPVRKNLDIPISVGKIHPVFLGSMKKITPAPQEAWIRKYMMKMALMLRRVLNSNPTT